MSKEIICEIDQIKYLFSYKPGKVISEQDNKLKNISEQKFTNEDGKDTEILSTKDRKFVAGNNRPPDAGSFKVQTYGNIGMSYYRENKKSPYKLGYWDKDNKFVEGYSPEAIKIADKMTRFMDETSKTVFNEIPKKNPFFYAYVLNNFNYYFSSGYKKRSLNIVVDSATTVKKVDPTTEKPKEIIEPGVKITSDETFVQPNFFDYNEATLTPAFKSFVNENIISYVNELKENVKKYGGTNEGILDSLVIKASSSKLRNGESKTVQNDGKNCSINPATKKPYEACPTHLTLSKARAEAAKNYIVEELMKNNIKIDESKIVLNYQGENGDGTSGPEFVQGDNPRDEKFSKAQRVDVDAVIAVRTNPQTKVVTPDPKLKETEPVEETDFRVVISGKQRKDFEIPTPSFDFLKFLIPKFGSGGGGSRAQLRQVRCSRF